MKRVILTIPFFILLSCQNNNKLDSDCLSSNLNDSIIAFYPFNEGNLSDESSNNNDLNNPTTATPTEDRNGNTNCAYLFNNSGLNKEYLTSTNTNIFNNLNKYSVSIWYEPHDPNIIGSTIEGLLHRGGVETQCADRMGEWSIGLYDSRRAVFGHNNSVWASESSLIDNWNHIVAIKNENEYKIYWNGILEEFKTGNANCSNLQEVQDIGDLFVGREFKGKIDDIIIYNKALSDSEVMQLYELDPCCV